MAYTSSQATPRSDIHALAMQANAPLDKLLLADKLLPPYPSEVKRGIYMRAKLGNAGLLNVDQVPRSPGAGYNRITRKFDTDTFDCEDWSLEEAIDDSFAHEVERFMNLETTSAALIMRNQRLAYEARVAAVVMNSTTFTATSALVAYTEANLATINVPGDTAAAKLRMLKNGSMANCAIMSANVFERIRRSTLLQNQTYGVVPKSAGQNALPNEAQVAEALGVETVYIGRGAKNGNTDGQTFSGSFIWPDTYLAIAYVAGGEFEAGGIGRTIQWTKDTIGLFTPETYREEQTRSDILRVRFHATEKVVDETAVELITTSYS